MPTPHPEISRLIQIANEAAAGQIDVPDALCKAVRVSVEIEVDPYILIGVLVEGIAHTIRVSIPAELGATVGGATIKLLMDRLGAPWPV